MRRALIGIALALLLATVSAAAMPPVDVEPWEMAPGTEEMGPGDQGAAADERADCPPYSESEINMIANVVKQAIEELDDFGGNESDEVDEDDQGETD